MKSGFRYIVIAVMAVLSLLLCSCSSEGQVLQKRQEHAERQTAALCGALARNTSLDSIRSITEQNEDVFFYIFDTRRMVYWSTNRLAGDEVFVTVYDTWRDMHFKNAETRARWTRAGIYNVLTIIPVKYAELQDIPDIQAIASQTFSFREMLEVEEEPSAFSINPYFYIIIGIFVLMIFFGLMGLLYYRGIRNMRLSTRIMYIIMVCVLAVFIYLFVMSMRYVNANFEQRQRKELQTRSEYIQSYLRSLYYWDQMLTSTQTSGLSVDLHDLGFDINQDIHVYSLNGELLASSSSALFSGGVLSRRMSPEALYSRTHSAVCYEQIASHQYLVSYVPFYNGAFVPIGYIALPYFMSEQTRNAELNDLLSRLLPPYLIVLFLALVFSFWAAKSMTAPISMLNDKMRHFKIGAKDNHIQYPYHDELGALVERYNLLVDQVEQSAEQLARAEREGAWRTMARQIAHEINNPLTPMKLSVQKLQRLRGSEGFDAYFEKAAPMLISEIDNLAHIAQSFSTFAKQPEVVTDEVDIAVKLSQVITLQRANDAHIPIRYIGADSGVMVLADQEQVAQVFVNIIRNALQALENQPQENRTPDIIVVLNAAYSEQEVEISISDNGPGIPADIQPKIFQPNFTTKSNGNGLGLAISKHIIEGTGGHISFETSDKGTTFRIYFLKK